MAWKDKNNPKRLVYRNNSNKRAMRRLKLDLIQAYGGRCECCGETHPGFLSLDHVRDDGAGERRGPGGSTNAVRRRLRREGYPKGCYRVLCYNCNMGRAYNGGICPHEDAFAWPVSPSTRVTARLLSSDPAVVENDSKYVYHGERLDNETAAVIFDHTGSVVAAVIRAGSTQTIVW